MEAGSEEEIDKNMELKAVEGSMKPKRRMKTPFQLDMLEKTYAMDKHPSEDIRAELSKKLDLTDRQLQMWFCHRRLKDKREEAAMASVKPDIAGSEEEPMGSEHGSGNGSESGSGSRSRSRSGSRLGSGSGSGSESDFGQYDNEEYTPTRFFESPRTLMQRRVIVCVEDQLGEPLREDGPILGMEFDELPHGAFNAPLEEKDGYISSYGGKHMESETYGDATPSHLYKSTVHGNGSVQLSSYPGNMNHDEDYLRTKRKRKSDDVGKEVQIHEKKIRKEPQKQDLLSQKKEEREKQKEEQRKTRENQKQEERIQREAKREMERQEKFKKQELLKEERRKQKEERLKEKEESRQKAAAEKARARKLAKESMELMDDERLELMELAASSKGLSSIMSLDYDTLENLDSFRDALCEFPPKSVQLRLPFAIQPWIDSEENIASLLMVWKFCVTFADILGLWPFTLDEFIQAFHDYDSRLLGEVHMALLKIIIKDIEDVARMPSGGPGTNQYTAVKPEGGHPHIVDGACLWGFDIRNWKKHLNPLTWPEILRQFSLSAGFGPRLKKKGVDHDCANDNNESEDIVSTLRNGSAAEKAAAIMQQKGSNPQSKSRHRLAPGTVKFAAYHVLAFEGSKGLNLIELAEKIQKSGLRDLSTSKTPEASISVALSRDPVLFERIAPCTYCVRPAFRKDPAEAEAIIAEAKEKIQRCANGFLADQTAGEGERDDDSDSDVAAGADVDVLATPPDANLTSECNKVEGNRDQDVEIDETRCGEPWVEGLTEGEYSNLSIEERLKALSALIRVANEGNTIRTILEDRQDAANALKKQMLAEALDKRQMKEEPLTENVNISVDNPPQYTTADQIIFRAQQNGYTTDRARRELKSYIDQKAEEIYAYRSFPLGQDRRRNCYWMFVASSSSQDPGSGRIFVESPNGNWNLIDSVESFNSLLTALDTRGTRESHLHIMLQKIENCFKDRVRRNRLLPDQESSFSFRIELGQHETEKENVLRRCADLQSWIWKECFNSSISYDMAYGKNPLLGICDACFSTYDAKYELCPSCCRIYSNAGDEPPRIRVIKALLTLFEVSVPSEALHYSWTEDCRNTWGLKLQNSLCSEDLLQVLSQLEGAVKRDYISADFETTKDLLHHYVSSNHLESSTLLLPWIPKTTAAVALRLFELNESISHTLNLKDESFDDEQKVYYRSVCTKEKDLNHHTPGDGKKGKRNMGSTSSNSSKQSIIQQHKVRTEGQKNGKGHRTLRKKRPQQNEETLRDYLNSKRNSEM